MTHEIMIHPSAIVDSDMVGEGTRIWAYAHIMKDAKVGRHCNICDHTFIENGVEIGDVVTVKNGVALYEGVKIEDHVFIGPNSVFTNDLRPRSQADHFELKTTLVKKGASIGANATIVCDREIGAYAFVAAGSVVIKDVKDFELVAGNPAAVKGHVCICRKKLQFSGNEAVCDCGHSYTKSESSVTLKE